MFKTYSPVDFAKFIQRTDDLSFILTKEELSEFILQQFKNVLEEQLLHKDKDWRFIWEMYDANHFKDNPYYNEFIYFYEAFKKNNYYGIENYKFREIKQTSAID